MQISGSSPGRIDLIFLWTRGKIEWGVGLGYGKNRNRQLEYLVSKIDRLPGLEVDPAPLNIWNLLVS